MPRGRHTIAGAAALVFLASLTQACGSGGASVTSTVNSYLREWNQQDYRAMAKLVDQPPPDFAAFHRQVLSDLDVTSAEHTAGEITEDGKRASVPLTSHYTTAPFGKWDAHGGLDLVKRDGEWRVVWSPQQIDKALRTGTRLSLRVDWPDRAPVLGAGGAALTVSAPMVRVGIQGSRVTDPGALTAALEQAGASSSQIADAIATARDHPDWFVPVLELPEARYQQLRPTIYPVPGTLFQTFATRQAVTPGLGAHVVGSVGPITAEQLDQLGPPYGANDTVGRAGVEAAYEHRLAGTPGASITVVDEAGNAVATLATFRAQPGAPAQLTIDPTVQRAAEQALDGITSEAALVAIRASTGEILASASVPTSRPFDIALRGQFPPGSTFKIVTTADLLEHGLSSSSPLTCPATITVGGQRFRNFEGEAVGSLTLAEAFALSCNAAFIGAAADLPAETFPSTATKFGLGTKPQIGLDAFGGSVPTPKSAGEQAATAIGQAQVVVSPLAMASVAATVAAGAWHAPRLVVGAPNDDVAPRSLAPDVTADLQAMMAAVVGNGTAARAGLPPGTHGKTGTAEFGAANPPETHAWFVGYRGDVAFAVLVVGGGVGGAVAAPIATKFLAALPA